MPKTNLQRKVSYYDKIIAESKNSPLTEEYKGICNALEQLVEFSRKLNNPKVKMNEKDFTELQNLYRATQNACSEYLNANVQLTPFEKDRSGIMKSISRLLDKDMAVLNKCDPKEPGSLSEIIGRSRSHSVSLREEDIQRVGGSLNNRIPLKTPSGKKGFFTPATTYNTDKQWAEQIEKHMKKFKENLDKYPKIDKNIMEKLKTDPVLIEEFCKYSLTSPYEEFLQYDTQKKQTRPRIHNVARILGVAPTAEEAGKILESDRLGIKKTVIDFIDSMANLVNQNGIMKAAGIEKNSNISNRNCAMSDMANLLGCGDLLAKSVPMKIKIGDREVEGVFMETVEGSDLNNLRDDDIIFDAKTDSFNSAKAMEQLTDLQVLDYVCGNIDRHAGNIIYQFDKDKNNNVTLKQIKGIDNDCAFGKITPKAGANVMKMVPPEKMQYITKRMLNKLETLNEDTIEMNFAQYNFSDQEKKAILSRAEKVKEAFKDGFIKRIDKSFWEKNPITSIKTIEGNYLHRIQTTAEKSEKGYSDPTREDYKEIHYMTDRRQVNNVLLRKADEIDNMRKKMNKVKAVIFNSSEYGIMEKSFKQVEKLSKDLKAEYKDHPERIPEQISVKLEKAYKELADKTLKYIELKKLVPSTGYGVKRREFAQELMDFADDTLQEMTKNPDLEATSKNDEPMVNEEINEAMKF